jgi:hypothetical protein
VWCGCGGVTLLFCGVVLLTLFSVVAFLYHYCWVCHWFFVDDTVLPYKLKAKQEEMRSSKLSSSEQPLSLLKTLSTILSTDSKDAALYIADLLNRSSTSPLFLNYIETHDEAVGIFANIVRAMDNVGPGKWGELCALVVCFHTCVFETGCGCSMLCVCYVVGVQGCVFSMLFSMLCVFNVV